MSERSARPRAPREAFHVGAKVYVRLGGRTRVARIIEDRGAIGQGGRRLLRVAFTGRGGQIQQAFEIPAAEVKSISTKLRPRRTTNLQGRGA